MARPLRITYEDAWYHVMNRGTQRRHIFTEDADRHSFMRLLSLTRQRHGIEIHAYALMGTHYHLLVRTPLANLSSAMQQLGSSYAQAFNQRHRTDGPMFKGRYKALLVDDDAYLAELIRYIHRNPVKAALTETATEYPWSSHAEYLGLRARPDFLTTSLMLAVFDGEPRRLDSFVHGPDSRQAQIVTDMIETGMAVGRSGDVRLTELLSRADRSPETMPDRNRLRHVPSIEEIEAHVAGLFGKTMLDLARPGKGHRNDALGLTMAIARRHGAASLRELADRYGYANYFGVNSAVRRIESRALDDPKIAEWLDSFSTPGIPCSDVA